MAQTVFKGFKQVTSALTSYENGYIYFVRTDANKADGYVYFNGKKYGTGVDAESHINAILGELPDGYSTFAAYINGVAQEAGQVAADLADEVARAKEAESGLSDAIAAEEDRATAAEAEIAGNLTAETAAREARDTELTTAVSANTTAISNEVTRATGVEEGLEGRIETIEGDYLKAEDKTELEGKISDEEARAKAAESGLAEDIESIKEDITAITGNYATKDELEAEATARTAADTALDNRIKVFEANGAHDVAAFEEKEAADKLELEGKITSAETAAKAYADEKDTALHTEITGEIATAKSEAITATTVTLESGITMDYAKVYTVKQGNVEIGTIDIPKDMVVSYGEIVTVENVKYLRLHIANSEEVVDISVADLAHVYSEGNGISISNSDVISAKVVEANGLSVDANGIKMGLADASNNGAMSSTAYNDLQTAKSDIETLNGADTLEGSVAYAVKQEENRATAAEAEIAGNLTAETAAREARDTELTTAVSANTTAINNEVTRATGVEEGLDTRLTAAESDIESLEGALTAETSERTAADNALEDRIEALEAFTADTATKKYVDDSVASAKSEAIETSENYTDDAIGDLNATVTGSSNDIEITVTEANGVLTAATAAVKISSDADNALKSTNAGLFAAVYYEDLDV